MAVVDDMQPTTITHKSTKSGKYFLRTALKQCGTVGKTSTESVCITESFVEIRYSI